MRWCYLGLILTVFLLFSTACTPEEMDQLLTAVPTITAPTPSATVGPPVIIDARVRDVSTMMSLISIYPAQGFEQVLVGQGAVIVGRGGHPLELAQIRPEDIITVYGPPIGDGKTLLATRIAVRPARAPRPGGAPVDPPEQVITRFFRRIEAKRIDEALRLISPAARARYGVDVWETRLRALRRVRLLSIARFNQAAWTPSWQEYLVVARVDAEPGSEWGQGTSRRYVDVVRGTDGPWLILDIRDEPGTPIHLARLEATLIRVDLLRRTLTIQPRDGSPRKIALSEQTQVVTADGWSLGLDELALGSMLVIEGLPLDGGEILPDRVTVLGVPGQPTIRLDPPQGAVGQEVRIIGQNWPPGAELKVYVTFPMATFRPEPVASGVADATGAFEIRLTIPRRWPDGAPVTEEVLNIVVSTVDYRAKARARFQVTK